MDSAYEPPITACVRCVEVPSDITIVPEVICSLAGRAAGARRPRARRPRAGSGLIPAGAARTHQNAPRQQQRSGQRVEHRAAGPLAGHPCQRRPPEQRSVQRQPGPEGQHQHAPRRRRPAAERVQHQQNGRRGAVAVRRQHAPRLDHRRRRQFELLGAPRPGSSGRPGAPPSRPRRRWSARAGPAARRPSPGRAPTAPWAPAATTPSGTRGRSPPTSCGRPSWCRSPPSSRPPPTRPAVRPGPTTTAAAASEKSACDTICWMSVAARRGLHVQAGELGAEQQRRLAAGHHEVG